MIDYERIGARIAEERKLIRHISQRKMAEDLFMYQADISNLEKAKSGSGITDLSKLDMIADYFAMPLEELIFGKKTDEMLKYLGTGVQLKRLTDYAKTEKQKEILKTIIGEGALSQNSDVYQYADYTLISILEVQIKMGATAEEEARLHKLHTFIFYKDELTALMVTNITALLDHVYQISFNVVRELLQPDVFDIADALTVLNPYWTINRYADGTEVKASKSKMYQRMNALRKLDITRNILYVESAYVREDYRRHGIFKMYIDFLKISLPGCAIWLNLQPTSGEEADHEYGYLPEYSVSEVGQININAAIAEKLGFVIDPRLTKVPSETIDSEGNVEVKYVDVRRIAYYLPTDLAELTKEDSEALNTAYAIDSVANHFIDDHQGPIDVYKGAWKKYGFIMSVKIRTTIGSMFVYARGWKIDDYRLGVSRANPAITGEEVEDIESYNSLEAAKESKYYVGLEVSALLYKSIFFGAESPNLNRYLNNLSVK